MRLEFCPRLRTKPYRKEKMKRKIIEYSPCLGCAGKGRYDSGDIPWRPNWRKCDTCDGTGKIVTKEEIIEE